MAFCMSGGGELHLRRRVCSYVFGFVSQTTQNSCSGCILQLKRERICGYESVFYFLSFIKILYFSSRKYTGLNSTAHGPVMRMPV